MLICVPNSFPNLGTMIYFMSYNLNLLFLLGKEDGVQQVFADNNMYYPVKITTEEHSPLEDFDWIRPTDFFRSLYKMNDLGHVLGGHNLKEAKPIILDFWKKYKDAYPQHQLWDHIAATGKDLAKCLPCFLHGDEGTSFKKGGIFIFSFQGAIGFGSSKRSKELEARWRALGEGIPLNFLRTGFQTRMLICVCPKDLVLKIPELTHFQVSMWGPMQEIFICYMHDRCVKAPSLLIKIKIYLPGYVFRRPTGVECDVWDCSQRPSRRTTKRSTHGWWWSHLPYCSGKQGGLELLGSLVLYFDLELFFLKMALNTFNGFKLITWSSYRIFRHI